MNPIQEHLLIVDDDAEIRSLLSRYLQKNGLRATAVADGRAMWQALDKGTFDLIVLDLMLPGDDGLTLCRTLRARSDMPVIMLTARGEETDRIVGLELGADDYIAKPFSPRELLARIKSVLRRAQPPAVRHRGHAIALLLQILAQQVANFRIVIDDEDVVGRSHDFVIPEALISDWKNCIAVYQCPWHAKLRYQKPLAGNS